MGRRTYKWRGGRRRVSRTSDVPASVAIGLSNKMDQIDSDCAIGKNIKQTSILDNVLTIIRSLIMIFYGTALAVILTMVFISIHALWTGDVHIAKFMAEMLYKSGS